MYNVLSITIPFFAIIFLGTLFSFNKIFNEDNSKTLTKFALYVTLPPFMFLNILKASSNNDIFNWNFIIRFEIVSIILLFLSFLISFLIIKNNKKESSIFSLNSTYPNYGYMGIPLCILAFGESSAIPISLILIVDTFVLLIFTSFFALKIKNTNILNEFFLLILNILKNPILAAVFMGFIFVLFDIKINIIILKFIEILSYAATPTALFAIGINLYNKLEKNSLIQISIISFIKLIIHPILILTVFHFFPSDIPNLWIKVAVLCSCLPVAGNVFAMSIYYNSFIKVTSSSIMVTTVLSTFTIPLILYFLI